jgi:hypothetical protein
MISPRSSKTHYLHCALEVLQLRLLPTDLLIEMILLTPASVTIPLDPNYLWQIIKCRYICRPAHTSAKITVSSSSIPLEPIQSLYGHRNTVHGLWRRLLNTRHHYNTTLRVSQKLTKQDGKTDFSLLQQLFIQIIYGILTNAGFVW